MRRPLWVLIAGLLAWGGGTAAAQAAPTIVTLGFDDGLVTQYANRDLLSSRALPATFYVNSGKVGGRGYMTWDQIAAMAADGHEIGGHTITHARLAGMAPAAQRTEICDDRTTLLARGLPALDFAYPFGSDDASANAIAQSCGYLSARTTRGIDFPTCDVCAETVPPRNAFSSRALQANASVTAAQLQLAVTNAQGTGGGWLQLVFHDICDGCDDYGVPAPTLATFFDWLVAQRAAGTLVVRTAAQVMQGTTPPPPPPPPADTTPPTVALTAPANGTVIADRQTPVTLSATAADAGGVARVEFLVNGAVVATDTTAPYSATFSPATVTGTSATIAARAVDAAGNAATSAGSTVQFPLPDTTPPTVALTAPANGTVIANPQTPVTLSATAADAGGVARVEFLVNGAVVATDTTAPYSATFSPATVTGTSATIAARAVDAAGNTATSAVSTVRILRPDTTKPTVTLTSPANGASVASPITIKATASDNVGVTAVRFLVDGTVRVTDTTAPYSATGALTRGVRSIAVEAVDAAGNTTRSPAISVRIR
jgi:peptidoglycan/xylan/chitin deacetylase (PgdA/CDA1 family)